MTLFTIFDVILTTFWPKLTIMATFGQGNFSDRYHWQRRFDGPDDRKKGQIHLHQQQYGHLFGQK